LGTLFILTSLVYMRGGEDQIDARCFFVCFSVQLLARQDLVLSGTGGGCSGVTTDEDGDRCAGVICYRETGGSEDIFDFTSHLRLK